MSAITANIIVEPITLDVTETSITQTVTVDPIDLSVYTAAPSSNPPGGANTDIQFNNGTGGFGGNSGFTFNNVSGNVAMPANVDIGGNIVIGGDVTSTTGIFTGDGGGLSNVVGANLTGEVPFAAVANSVAGANVSGQVANALVAGTVYTAAQPNITSVGTLTGLDVNGSTDLGVVTDVRITGGTNGYVLQTNGAGSLTWVAQGGAGTGNPGGANTNVQFNDAGLFGGQAGFEYDKTTNVLTANVALGYGFDDVELTTTTTSNQYMFFNDFSVRYQTVDATQDADLDFRGDASTTLDTLLPVGKSITGVFVMKNGTTAYNVNTVSIDGVTQTVKYVNNSTPTTAASSLSSFTFTIVKLDATPTYDVLGSATRFG